MGRLLRPTVAGERVSASEACWRTSQSRAAPLSTAQPSNAQQAPTGTASAPAALSLRATSGSHRANGWFVAPCSLRCAGAGR